MPPKSHAALGASSAHRWMACPGSVRMSEGRPDDTSIYAAEGTAAHELAEACIGDDGDAADSIGDAIEVEGFTITVTEEMAEAVQVFVDHVRSRWGREDSGLYLELAMSLAPLNPPADMFGTGDAVIWHPGTRLLEIIDYKHGKGVAVDATENEQLLYYALAAVVTLKVRPELIRMTIVQPRGHHPAGPIRTAEVGWEELKAFKRELFERAKATLEPDAPLVVGDHCRFCRALAVCPAQHETAVAVAQSEFEPLAPPDPEELTPEHLAVVLAASGRLKDWLSAVEAHALNLMDRGEDVPGFKLVEGRKGNRSWVDEARADKKLAYLKVKAADRYTKKLVSPAQAEKLLKKIGKPMPEGLVTRTDGKPKIVAADDARPALPPSVLQDFVALPAASEEGGPS